MQFIRAVHQLYSRLWCAAAYEPNIAAWGANGHSEPTSSAWEPAGSNAYDTSPPVMKIDRADEVLRWPVCMPMSLATQKQFHSAMRMQSSKQSGSTGAGWKDLT